MPTPSMPRGMNPLVAGYSFGSPGGASRTALAGGAPRYGLQWDRGVQPFTVTLLLDRLQFSVWNAFYLQVIKQGSVSFMMPLDSGFGIAAHLVNIVPGTYSVAALDAKHASVAFTVEAESQAYQLTDEEAAGLVEMYGIYSSRTSELLRRLAQFATVDSLALDL